MKGDKSGRRQSRKEEEQDSPQHNEELNKELSKLKIRELELEGLLKKKSVIYSQFGLDPSVKYTPELLDSGGKDMPIELQRVEWEIL